MIEWIENISLGLVYLSYSSNWGFLIIYLHSRSYSHSTLVNFPLLLVQEAQNQRIHEGSSLIQIFQVIYTLNYSIKVITINKTIEDTTVIINKTIKDITVTITISKTIEDTVTTDMTIGDTAIITTNMITEEITVTISMTIRFITLTMNDYL